MMWILVLLVWSAIGPGEPYPTKEACEAAGGDLIMDPDTPALVFNCVQATGEEA